jgi:hypothetical protein
MGKVIARFVVGCLHRPPCWLNIASCRRSSGRFNIRFCLNLLPGIRQHYRERGAVATRNPMSRQVSTRYATERNESVKGKLQACGRKPLLSKRKLRASAMQPGNATRPRAMRRVVVRPAIPQQCTTHRKNVCLSALNSIIASIFSIVAAKQKTSPCTKEG